jgi:polyisoprenoid-binding protein YceI
MAMGKKCLAMVAAGLLVIAAAVPQAVRAGAAAPTFRIDPVHSSVVFRVKHAKVAYFNGRFNEVSGTVALDDQNPAGSSLNITINAGSVDTASAKRDGHIKSADFLNAKQFPSATFKSKSVTKADGESFEVQGDLTLHGVTKPMTVKLTRTGVAPSKKGGTTLGLESVFTIKRSEFGMDKMLEMLGDDVTITLDLECGS